jgi:putative flippase GtrA
MDYERSLALSLTEIEEMQISGELYNQTQDAHRHRLHISSSTFWQFFRFCLVGGANTIIDLLAFNILLRCFSTNNVLVLVACNSMAYASGAVSSFLLNKYWTFRHNKQGMTSRELVPFVISVALQILCSNGLLWLAGKVLQPLIANTTLWANAAKIVSVAVGAVISYIFMRFWVFAGGSQDQPTM